jgi:hypothetical protein
MSNQLPANRIYKSSSPRAVLAMAGAGDLEKLPLEIRNEIYVLVFTRPKPLVLCNFGGDQPGIDRRGLDNEWARSATATKVAPLGYRRSVKAIGHQRVGQKWVKAPSKIALICVNEKVSAEAVAVLYSRTKFRFARAGTVRRFLNLIGDKKQYLRDVGMCVCGWKFGRGFYEARYAMEALAAAKCIRRVEVAHVDVCPQVPATSRRIYPGSQKVVKLCEPLLNSLKTAYEDKDLNASVLDVVRISAVDNYCTVGVHSYERGHGLEYKPCGCTRKQRIEANDELQLQLKHLVAKQHEVTSGRSDKRQRCQTRASGFIVLIAPLLTNMQPRRVVPLFAQSISARCYALWVCPSPPDTDTSLQTLSKATAWNAHAPRGIMHGFGINTALAFDWVTVSWMLGPREEHAEKEHRSSCHNRSHGDCSNRQMRSKCLTKQFPSIPCESAISVIRFLG